MHSFQPSRGRIFFEVFCALTISGSCAGAWSQTGAWAFLPAAAVSLLYALIRMFDLAGMRPTAVREPQRVQAEPAEPQPVAVDKVELAVPSNVAEVAVSEFAEQPLSEARCAEIVELVEATSRSGSGRRKGGSRKAGGRRTAAAKEPVVVEEAVAVEEVLAQVDEAVEADLPVQAESIDPAPEEEVYHSPVAPLFEPEPFVRMQRQAFGRRGRI